MNDETAKILREIADDLRAQLSQPDGRTDLQYVMDMLTGALRICEADDDADPAVAVLASLLRGLADALRPTFDGLAQLERTLRHVERAPGKDVAGQLRRLYAAPSARRGR
jgi:hypothetical protein